MTDILYWLALNTVPGVGPSIFHKLVSCLGDAHGVFSASPSRLSAVEGVGDKLVQAIKDPQVLRDAEEELKRVQDSNTTLITLRDTAYPQSLKEIYDPPPLLYVRGTLGPADVAAVALVGSRRCSGYGRALARKFSKDLASAGVCIVSGMARGIDTMAHQGALDADGMTYAVLGSGLDVIYPPENKRLYQTITEHGAVISEFPLNTRPEPYNFPKRNRIISGLSMGVVVVEAGAKSGSLITASYALDQGRDVYAVPGNVGTSTSQGTNRLIKQGAKLVETADEVLEDLLPDAVRLGPHSAKREVSEDEGKILAILSYTPVHIDEISRQTGLQISRLSSLLLDLELKGLASQLSGKNFVLA